MERKKVGTLLWQTKEIYKVALSLILLFSCTNQEESLFEKEFKDLTQFAKIKKSKQNGLEFIHSPIISEFLGLENQFIYLRGGGTLKEPFSYSEIIISPQRIDFYYDRAIRYLFIEKRMNSGRYKLVDTLRIDKEFYYSVASLSTDGQSDAIVIGTCSQERFKDQYLIHKIHEISKSGKLKSIPLSTKLYDCPPPTDCFGDESREYSFGVLGGKMMKRYWYEK